MTDKKRWYKRLHQQPSDLADTGAILKLMSIRTWLIYFTNIVEWNVSIVFARSPLPSHANVLWNITYIHKKKSTNPASFSGKAPFTFCFTCKNVKHVIYTSGKITVLLIIDLQIARASLEKSWENCRHYQHQSTYLRIGSFIEETPAAHGHLVEAALDGLPTLLAPWCILSRKQGPRSPICVVDCICIICLPPDQMQATPSGISSTPTAWTTAPPRQDGMAASSAPARTPADSAAPPAAAASWCPPQQWKMGQAGSGTCALRNRRQARDHERGSPPRRALWREA